MVENLSKQYRLGEVGTGTISHDLNRWWHRIRGKEDPFLKIGETNDRATKSNNPYVWALKDINFEVQKGEVLGIIGKNGAGKSTLLKLLSRVTSPTTGSIKARGRIASLLEVGTGFHPEMTGRENIYMNGTIMGMSRHEIKAKLEEIANFAGVDRYLDTPVKRYSSGMTVRLGFAIAAHLDPEILIVDEVLAVGDAEFQRKAIGKMKDVSNSEGRTVLFVSHNMASIQRLCTKSILMKHGQIISQGKTNKIVEQYLNSDRDEPRFNNENNTAIIVESILFENSYNEPTLALETFQNVTIRVKLKSKSKLSGVSIAIEINNQEGLRVTTIWSKLFGLVFEVDPGLFEIKIAIEELHLSPGLYNIGTYIDQDNVPIQRIHNFTTISVNYSTSFGYVREPLQAHGVYFEKVHFHKSSLSDSSVR